MCKAHHWQIPTPTYGEHLIGICKLCGEKRNFTELQERDKGWGQICLTNTLTRPEVSMRTIMAQYKPKANREMLSRGRVI